MIKNFRISETQNLIITDGSKKYKGLKLFK